METVDRSAWFNTWFDSPFYDRLYARRDHREADSFIRGLMQRLKLPEGARVLDVGCGNGRHSRVLSGLGFDVLGIDQSARMVSEARRHEKPGLHFLRHDMREPFAFGGFGLVVNLFTSFGFFETREEHDRSIGNMAGSLSADGTLVMDFLNADHVAANLVPEERKTVDGLEFHVERRIDECFIYKSIRVIDTVKGDVHLFEERVRAFRLNDFREMFGHAGIYVAEVYGDYAWTPFDALESPRLVMFGRKRPQKAG